ncbi:hypothetical protein GLYMA_17G139300v4 [Glycine max]|uniref:Uncharacterized protein n=1 Tax=Glycine max TaxID=3847 RepID=K7MLK0_SOYBN|nr:hypothetical protein GYH30_047230 [Glycine max]KRH04092.1 hypothetical protein GLYMA_17G139300v4 [Glycine max]
MALTCGHVMPPAPVSVLFSSSTIGSNHSASAPLCIKISLLRFVLTRSLLSLFHRHAIFLLQIPTLFHLFQFQSLQNYTKLEIPFPPVTFIDFTLFNRANIRV